MKEQEIHEAFLLDLGLGGAGIVLPKVTDQNSLDISVKKMKLKVSMGEEVNLEIPCKMASIKETKSGVRLGLKFDDHLQFNTTKTLQEFVFSLQRKQLKAMQN